LAGKAVSFGSIGLFGYMGYQDKVRKGWNPMAAAGVSVAEQALPFVVHPALYIGLTMGLPAVRLGGQLMTAAVQNQNNAVRLARTPFSHRFEHTDMTSAAQSRGLQAIGSAWGHSQMGSEAAAFARRYGR
jgi:hypothetical protein